MNKKVSEETDWYDKVPFDDGKPEEYYSYRCKRCNYEEGVPDFVVDEFAMGEDLKPGELPGVVCPKCNGDMEWTGETYFEEI